MKLPQIKQHKWNYLALSFFVPLIGFLSIMLFGGYEPFGNSRSMLYSDMYHQYYPFFVSFRNMLRSGDSLLDNWNIGMGLDFVGLFSYYLASPLNLITVILPESWMLEYFSLLSPIKLSLASLFFAIFLKKSFHQDDLSITLFGAFYGLCAWAFGYQWNVMWLDTFALLPLVALGTIALLRDGKFFLYTVTLFLSIFANYYVGFFTCIFVLLIFICYEICRFKGFYKLFSDLMRIALFSVLAIGMTVILELPTLAALQTTQSSVNKFPEGFRLNIADENTWQGLLDAMRQVLGNMGGGLTPSFKEGLPNLYCGVGTIVFAFLILSSGQVKIRDKICSVFLLLFFIVSFIIRQLDYIWHGFHFTNMIPYRFSFLYSFVLLFLAYRVWILRRRIRLWQVLVALALTFVMLFSSDSYISAAEHWQDSATQTALSNLLSGFSSENLKAFTDQFEIADLMPAINVIFLLAYSVVLVWYAIRIPFKKNTSWYHKQAWYQAVRSRKKAACTALTLVMVVEFVFSIVFFGITFNSTNLSHYPRGTEDSERIINIMHELEEDTLFYRAETTHTQTYNDGALNGYNGVTTFTSSANADVTNFMRGLGYGAMENWNRYAFEEGSPVANLYLNLKYMIERQGQLEKNPYFEDIHSSGKVHLLKNKYYLPLGFMADPALAESNFHDLSNTANAFEKQNKLLSDTLGEQIEPWSLVCGDNVSIASTDTVTISNVNTDAVGSCSYKASSSGSVFYTYTFDRSGFFCISYNMPKRNDITVSYDDGSGYKTLYTEGYAIPFTMAVCQVEPGDRVQITLKCKSGESSSLKLWGGLLDQRVMDYAHQELSRNTLELTKFENTFVEGNITCDKAGLLYTSIPQSSDNWHVYVDGEEKDVTLIGGAMVGVMLEEGSHTVTFRYRNKAFNLGCIVSAVCAVVFAAICWFIYYYLKKNPGKFEKVRALTVPPLPPAPPPVLTKKDISEQERAKAVKERMKKNKKRKKR